MAAPRLGKVQLQIMRVLWDRKEATAREITDALSRTQNIAHSTVQTLLRKLEDKGAVGHEQRDRTFLYRALVRANDVQKRHTKDFVDRLFGGSVSGLVCYLLENERISERELDHIRDLIESTEKEEQSKGPVRKIKPLGRERKS